MKETALPRREQKTGAIFSPQEAEHAAALLARVSEPLLAWYDQNARVLPWRSDPTPYRVWISEIMLQQTRVEAARGYFERFVEALPDVFALAAVEEDALLKLWEGLGYYSRARNLKHAAQIVVEQFGGRLPADFSALRKLPGIGEYSAGSIGSIAFGLRVPAVDGNVLRVVSRLLSSRADVTLPAVKRELTALVAGMPPEARGGDFNQSLMELGAVICLPNGAPLCLLCPLAGLCEGLRTGAAPSLPVRTAKKPRRVQQITVFLLTRKGNLYLRKRPAGGLLAGLWELPNIEGALSRKQADEFLGRLGIAHAPAEEAGTGHHIFTHVEWRMTLYSCELDPGASAPEGWVPVSPEDLTGRYPLPSAFLTLLKNL